MAYRQNYCDDEILKQIEIVLQVERQCASRSCVSDLRTLQDACATSRDTRERNQKRAHSVARSYS